ncbi:YcjF family protein [Thaumasiovibrio sp. DFM-14]|uniref:YcjF family protein n=1 Tax=Thaumasiovibrio sp. DFM-14 TaxID=3384792 RepID=UPI0039A1E3AB
MSIKGRIEFPQPKEATKQSNDMPLTAQTLFDDTAPFELTTTAAEEQLTNVLTVQKKNKRWGWRIAAVSFIGLVAGQTVTNISTSISQGDWLSLGWSGLIGGVAVLGVSAIVKEAWYLRHLKRRQHEREVGERLLANDGIGEAKGFCQQLMTQSGKHSEGYDRWLHALSGTHNDREVLEMFDSMVLSVQDEHAKALVAKHAREAGMMVAVSPLATADMLLVAWRALAMVNGLSRIYGVELSYVSRLAMLKMLIRNMALVGASEIAIDASMDMLSMDLTGKISVRAGQGLGVGLLTARLGLRTMEMLRPLPWLGERPLRLSMVRKELLLKFKSLLSTDKNKLG